jgi:hypothetical protein
LRGEKADSVSPDSDEAEGEESTISEEDGDIDVIILELVPSATVFCLDGLSKNDSDGFAV